MVSKNKKPKIFAIFIAYNAAKSLERFYKAFPKQLVDKIILVDDASKDETFNIGKKLGIECYRNAKNLGYGGNVKRALSIALEQDADVIIDIHPDGEYSTSSIEEALEKTFLGHEFILGTRFTEETNPSKTGMFLWKFYPLKVLNFIDKLILGIELHDFHQGFRVYTKELLEKINFLGNSDDYLFSFEIIVQAIHKNAKISEVPIITTYKGKKRGASLKSCIIYASGTFKTLSQFLLDKLGYPVKIFQDPKLNYTKKV